MRIIVESNDEGSIQVAQGLAREFFAGQDRKDLYEQVSCIVKNPAEGSSFKFLVVSGVESAEAVTEMMEQIKEISVIAV